MQHKVLTATDDIQRSNFTSLRGYLDGHTYYDLVRVLGNPTFDSGSFDSKVQKEWIVSFCGRVFTIYDWKTYSEEYTMTKLTRWNVGGHVDAKHFIAYIKNLLIG